MSSRSSREIKREESDDDRSASYEVEDAADGSPEANGRSPPPRNRSRSPRRSIKKERRSSKRSRSRTRSRSPRPKRHKHSSSRRRSRSRTRSRSLTPAYRSGRRGRSPPYSRSRRGGGGYRGGGGGRYGSRQQDDPSPNRCLGVFGLSLYTTERDLKDYFGKYGDIESVQLVYDHPTGRSRGFGFIYFEKQDDAVEAKEECAGIELDGHRIRVDYSSTRRAHTPTPGVYMGRPSFRGSGGRGGGRGRGGYDGYEERGGGRARSRSYSPAPRRDYYN